MPKYLLIIKETNGECFTAFYDNFVNASNARLDAECGLGAYTELYEYMRSDPDDLDEPESYILIM